MALPGACGGDRQTDEAPPCADTRDCAAGEVCVRGACVPVDGDGVSPNGDRSDDPSPDADADGNDADSSADGDPPDGMDGDEEAIPAGRCEDLRLRPDSINYGCVDLGNYATRSLMLCNEGSGHVDLLGLVLTPVSEGSCPVAIEGAFAFIGTVPSPRVPFPLDAGDCFAISVEHTPYPGSADHATLKFITSVCSISAPLSRECKCRCYYPSLMAFCDSGERCEFGETQVDRSTVLGVTVENYSIEADREIALERIVLEEEGDANFRIEFPDEETREPGEAVSLCPGDRYRFNIVFTPQSEGPHENAVLIFHPDHGTDSPIALPLHGDATAAEP
ncbi:MAG: hypothetical protein C4523_00575 [Myxococcales bacterium]|nr:MAG: hypothetical protein C4523_00575 [Myxococcales bacterium]